MPPSLYLLMVFETSVQLLPSVCVSLSSFVTLGGHSFLGVENPSVDVDPADTRFFGVVGLEGVVGFLKTLSSSKLLHDSSLESSSESSNWLRRSTSESLLKEDLSSSATPPSGTTDACAAWRLIPWVTSSYTGRTHTPSLHTVQCARRTRILHIVHWAFPCPCPLRDFRFHHVWPAKRR